MKRELLSSPSNPLLRQLQALRESRARKKNDWARIDGARELLRALDAELPLRALVVCPSRLRSEDARIALERAEATGLLARELTPELYDLLRYGDRDEGLCAAVGWEPMDLEQLEPSEPALLLVLDGIEKPGNLGAVLRSADAAGIDAVIVCDAPIDLRNPNVVRASMGTLFTQAVLRSDGGSVRAWLRARGIRAACALVDGAQIYSEADLRGPLAIVLGAEHVGLGAEWADFADLRLRIPMKGLADSLNLSVSAGILLYEAQRQRR